MIIKKFESFSDISDTKIVDKDGNPKVVYRSQKDNRKLSTQRQSNLKGIYFSEDKDSTKIYGDKTKEYYLNIKNPLILVDNEWNLSILEPHIYDMLIRKGYDGAIWMRKGIMYEIIAFYDWQVIPK